MADNMDKIIDKIQKLFELANSPNESEAASAMAKAHELLQKYNLSMDAVTEKGEAPGVITEDFGKADRVWELTLVNAIAKANYCGMFRFSTFTHYGPSGRIIFDYHMVLVGKEHNVTAVKVMAEYIIGAIDKGAKRMYGKGKSLIASYKVGFANAVESRLYEMRKKDMETSDCRDLVVVADAEVKDYFAKAKMGKYNAKTTTSNVAGYAAGALDGRNLPLNGQIGGKSTQRTAIA
jgi:hypothetical protein